jgi:LacI family gluconate utilization system Gnt-I transcriptional repressor
VTRRPRRATLHDVARVAGVSAISVSRALRAPGLLAPATRRRIEQAVVATGYIPDLVARSFKSRITGLVAAIVPSITNSVYADTLQGISDVMHANGRELMVGVSGLSLAQEESLVRTFLGRRPDGVIVTGTDHSPTTRSMLRRAGIPVVETWTLTPRPIDMNVGYSDEAACTAMVRHLHATGYRRIGFICGPTADNDRARRRLKGYRAACVQLGLPDGLAVVLESETDIDGGRLGLGQLLARDRRIDAVFCSSDVFAAGVLFECQRRGWRVPDRLAIAGFQGLPLAAAVHPAFTTVRIPRYEIGRNAAELLLASIRGERIARRRVDVGFAIVQRESA